MLPLFGGAPQHQDVSLKSVGKTLRRRVWLILLVVGVCLGLAALASKLLTPQYMAEAQILFTQEAPSPTGVNEDPDAPPRNETIGTQVSMLLTRAMAERAATSIEKAANKAGLNLSVKDTDPDELRTRLRVDNPERTDLITLSIEAENPDKSALLVNNYAKSFVAWKKGIAEEKSRVLANGLSARLEAAKEDLRNAQAKLLAYQQSNDVQDLSEQTKSLIEDYSKRLSDQGDLDRDALASEEQLGQIGELAKSQSKGIKISHWIRDDNLILGLQKDLSDAEVERAHTAIKFRPGYPGVFEPIDAKITDLKGRIRDVVDHSVGLDVPTLASQADAVNQYRRALVDTTYVRARQNANKRVLAHIKTHLDKLPELQRNFANLSRDAEAAAARVSLLQTRFASAKAGIPSAQSNVAFVGVASPPKKVSRPRLGVNLVLGLLVGLFLAAVIVLAAESKNPIVYDADQLKSVCSLPIVPVSSPRKGNRARGEAFDAALEVCAFLNGVLSENTAGSVILAHAVEEYEDGISGSDLASGFARLGRRVLLIRFAPPSISRFIEPGTESELYAGSTPQAPRIVDMPSLSEAGNEALEKGRLEEVIGRCRSIYDVVILSACSAEDAPDYLMLRPHSDLHLVLIQMGQTRIADLRLLQERIQAMKGGRPYGVAIEGARGHAKERNSSRSITVPPEDQRDSDTGEDDHEPSI